MSIAGDAIEVAPDFVGDLPHVGVGFWVVEEARRRDGLRTDNGQATGDEVANFAKDARCHAVDLREDQDAVAHAIGQDEAAHVTNRGTVEEDIGVDAIVVVACGRGRLESWPPEGLA